MNSKGKFFPIIGTKPISVLYKKEKMIYSYDQLDSDNNIDFEIEEDGSLRIKVFNLDETAKIYFFQNNRGIDSVAKIINLLENWLAQAKNNQ